ncbi:LytR C-terminal domain-containing protein [Pseudonocardia sp. RS010]|uniref:LytR C-terminal domain-containing protein n=1 Tax=Pseudonocardia sp. RS010 TaxID=3385979 RepID=UPI0039A2F911
MTAPASGPSPLKVGGVALIGVAVIAAVIGLVTLGIGGGSSDGSDSTAAAPPTASVAPATPAPGSGTDEVPVPSFAPTPTALAPDGAAPGAPPGGAGDGANGAGVNGANGVNGVYGSYGGGAGAASAPTMPLRVYNNSTVEGLAARAASDFRNGGWTVTDTTGYPYGVIPTSTVYYRQGTAERASADRLAQEYGLRVEPRFDGIQDASPGLIVIVTQDYTTSK